MDRVVLLFTYLFIFQQKQTHLPTFYFDIEIIYDNS